MAIGKIEKYTAPKVSHKKKIKFDNYKNSLKNDHKEFTNNNKLIFKTQERL